MNTTEVPQKSAFYANSGWSWSGPASIRGTSRGLSGQDFFGHLQDIFLTVFLVSKILETRRVEVSRARKHRLLFLKARTFYLGP